MIRAECAQDIFTVGQACSVDVRVCIDRTLVSGDTLEFQFPNSWLIVSGPSFTRDLQCTDPEAPHYVAVEPANVPDARFKLEIVPRHLNYPEGVVRHGRLIRARVASGTIPPDSPILIHYRNTFAPYVAEVETLWIRIGEDRPRTPVTLRTQGGPQEHLRLLVPSGVEAGREFEVRIVSLDGFDNPSTTGIPRGRLLLADGSVVAETPPGNGVLRIPVRLDAPGVYRFRFGTVLSNAVRVQDGAGGPFWGDLHIHTRLSHDAQGTDPYGYAREVGGLEFAAVADHWESLGPEGYQTVQEWTVAADCPGQFAVIPADERNCRELTGHHNVYFRDLASFERYRAIGSRGGSDPANRFAAFRDADPAAVMVIPHHTGITFGALPASGIGCAVDWDACDDRGLRPVMEIYSHHGQSERYDPQHVLAYEFNRMRNRERRANTSIPGPFYAQDYWMRGRRLGVIGSSDEHSGQGGRRHGGIAAVFAGALTREAVFDAIRDRRCYATTGERILVDFSVDNVPMGRVLRRRRGDRIRIALRVWGTDILLRVDILRFRFGLDTQFHPVISVSPRPESMDASVAYEDTVDVACVYYARAVQEPLAWPGMAWTSPVWIDPDPEGAGG